MGFIEFLLRQPERRTDRSAFFAELLTRAGYARPNAQMAAAVLDLRENNRY